jgi:hypothetical protein
VPIWSGEVEAVNFVAYIPCSLLKPKAAYQSAHSIIQFGHGLLGTREEGLSEMRGRCEETASVLWAIDWAGVEYASLASWRVYLGVYTPLSPLWPLASLYFAML